MGPTSLADLDIWKTKSTNLCEGSVSDEKWTPGSLPRCCSNLAIGSGRGIWEGSEVSYTVPAKVNSKNNRPVVYIDVSISEVPARLCIYTHIYIYTYTRNISQYVIWTMVYITSKWARTQIHIQTSDSNANEHQWMSHSNQTVFTSSFFFFYHALFSFWPNGDIRSHCGPNVHFSCKYPARRASNGWVGKTKADHHVM